MRPIPFPWSKQRVYSSEVALVELVDGDLKLGGLKSYKNQYGLFSIQYGPTDTEWDFTFVFMFVFNTCKIINSNLMHGQFLARFDFEI